MSHEFIVAFMQTQYKLQKKNNKNRNEKLEINGLSRQKKTRIKIAFDWKSQSVKMQECKKKKKQQQFE